MILGWWPEAVAGLWFSRCGQAWPARLSLRVGGVPRALVSFHLAGIAGGGQAGARLASRVTAAVMAAATGPVSLTSRRPGLHPRGPGHQHTARMGTIP
jgi:hypothetical protein